MKWSKSLKRGGGAPIWTPGFQTPQKSGIPFFSLKLQKNWDQRCGILRDFFQYYPPESIKAPPVPFAKPCLLCSKRCVHLVKPLCRNQPAPSSNFPPFQTFASTLPMFFLPVTMGGHRCVGIANPPTSQHKGGGGGGPPASG